MKKFFGIIFSRLLYTLLFVAVQGAALYFVLRFFETRFVWFYAAGVLLSVLTGLHVISSGMTGSYLLAAGTHKKKAPAEPEQKMDAAETAKAPDES